MCKGTRFVVSRKIVSGHMGDWASSCGACNGTGIGMHQIVAESTLVRRGDSKLAVSLEQVISKAHKTYSAFAQNNPKAKQLLVDRLLECYADAAVPISAHAGAMIQNYADLIDGGKR